MSQYLILVRCVGAAIVLLLIGFATDLIAGLRTFADHLASVPLILASFTPWTALFLVIAGIWATIIDRFFQRYNGNPTQGIAYELAHDNNTAAAILLTLPIAIIATLLIAITILTR